MQQKEELPFEPHELNHVILTIYNILGRTIRDHCDELSLASNVFKWKKNGLVIGDLDLRSPTVSCRESLQLIFARDEKRRAIFYLFTETDAEIIYKVKGH